MKSMFKGALGALVVVLALSGMTAASALAAGAPTVETKPATAVTETGATLVGKINPNGASTKYYFEYGKTTSYGSKTAETTLKSATSEVEVSKIVEGLTAHTTYHFRLVATNQYGTSDGADEVLSTLVGPEVVVTEGKITELEANLTGGTATIGWNGNQTMTCTGHEVTFYFTSATEVEGRMVVRECYAQQGGGKRTCSNGSEAITSETLKGRLGYTNKANKEVGLILEGKSSNVWAKNVTCSGAKEPITGELGGDLVLPVNKVIARGSQFKLKYQMSKTDEQSDGSLGGQLHWGEGSALFGLETEFLGSANRGFEIKA
jgi:hypothetical protein